MRTTVIGITGPRVSSRISRLSAGGSSKTVGVNVTVFSLINGILFADIPVQDDEVPRERRGLIFS